MINPSVAEAKTFQSRKVKLVAADALAPSITITRSSAAMVLTM